MKYKVGDFVATENTVLLEVVAAIDGDPEIYGMKNIKEPAALRWFTLWELDHEGLSKFTYNPHEFDDAEAGDNVKCGPEQYRRILSRVGNVILVSRVGDHLAKEIVKVLEQNKREGHEIPEDFLGHMKGHASNITASNAADTWYDIHTMTLMNWKLVRE